MVKSNTTDLDNKKTSDKLRAYIPLVHFLGRALGKNYEVFLYDLSQAEHRILAIENGFLSGRSEGSLMKDVIIKVLKNEEKKNKNELIQKDAVSRDGRHFKSSSLLIRDEKGKPIGAMCINFMIDDFIKINDFMKTFNINFGTIKKIDPSKVMFDGEVFAEDRHSDSNIESIYNRVLTVTDVDIKSVSGRQSVIDALYKEGVFNIRGSVNYISEKLGISEPSVYRYLNKSKGR